MKKSYKKTKWVDHKTPVCAQNLNKIEEALSDIYEKALEADSLVGGRGVKVEVDSLGNKEISLGSEAMTSSTCTGIEWCQSIPETWERGKIYFVLDFSTKELSRIMLNGITIFNRNNG